MRRSLVLLLVALAACAFAQSPESTVQKFADTVSRNDLESAAKLVVGGSVSPDLMKIAQAGKERMTMELSNLRTSITGSKATVTYHLKVTGTYNPPEQDESLTLVKSGTEWLIQATPVALLNDTRVLPMIAFLLGHPREARQAGMQAAKSTACLSNSKQLALGCFMYATDSDDVLKFGVSDWTTKIYPYTKNKSVFTCPEDAKGVVSYSLNPRVAGKNFSKIKKPANTVLLYEGKNGKLNFRHTGRAAVAFCDGHAKLINAQQAKSLVWNP